MRRVTQTVLQRKNITFYLAVYLTICYQCITEITTWVLDLISNNSEENVTYVNMTASQSIWKLEDRFQLQKLAWKHRTCYQLASLWTYTSIWHTAPVAWKTVLLVSAAPTSSESGWLSANTCTEVARCFCFTTQATQGPLWLHSCWVITVLGMITEILLLFQSLSVRTIQPLPSYCWRHSFLHEIFSASMKVKARSRSSFGSQYRRP